MKRFYPPKTPFRARILEEQSLRDLYLLRWLCEQLCLQNELPRDLLSVLLSWLNVDCAICDSRIMLFMTTMHTRQESLVFDHFRYEYPLPPPCVPRRHFLCDQCATSSAQCIICGYRNCDKSPRAFHAPLYCEHCFKQPLRQERVVVKKIKLSS